MKAKQNSNAREFFRRLTGIRKNKYTTKSVNLFIGALMVLG